MKVVSAVQMQKIDYLAQKKYGIPSIVLMENAGRSSAVEILKYHKRGKGAIFCGKGNNGGDGFVCARYLKNSGIEPSIFLLGRIHDIKSSDALCNLNIFKKMKGKIKEITTEKNLAKIKRTFFRYDFIVDAIFGIGFKGVLPRHIACIINFLNTTHKPIYALDVPSGLDATKGVTHGICIKAHTTITFGLPKKGFLNKVAKRYVGRVVVGNIGLPIELLK